MKTSLAALFLTALPALADELPSLAPAETRYGRLTIGTTTVEGSEAQQILLNGTPVAGLVDRLVEVRAVAPRPDGDEGDWVLVSLSNGGNGCPMMWAFVNVTSQGAIATESFGTCSESVLNPRTTDNGSLEFDMPSFLPEEELVVYTYDGFSVSEFAVKRSNDGAVAAGGGDDATRWIGQHPTVPFAEASERLRFATIMSEEQVYELAERVGVGDVVIEVDGFVVGQGFDPKAGGDIAAMWGIRISDGLPFAIFRDAGLAPLGFVEDEDAADGLPQIAEDYLNGG
jgi:hypothetical protein